MEKIKLEEDKEYSAAELAIECAEKINKIIDWINGRFSAGALTPLGEDRLKTLEDKVKKLQDFWDEQDKKCEVDCKEQNSEYCPCDFVEPPVNKEEPSFPKIEKHSTCKHSPIYSGKRCDNCKEEKIEEIISELKTLEIIPLCPRKDKDKAKMATAIVQEIIMPKIESWLRDKLRNL